MSKVVSGNTVSVHYRGTLKDGTEFDNSYDRGEPITFQVGGGQMISGFDEGVLGMEVGETKELALSPEQAYGPHIAEAVQVVPKETFPEGFDFEVGGMAQGSNPEGRPMVGTILEHQEESVTLDFNHPMAGKNLNFQIEIVNVQE